VSIAAREEEEEKGRKLVLSFVFLLKREKKN